MSTPTSSSSSLGLARRYRPRTFSELTGQRHVSAVLRRAVLAGNIPQQLLFSGGSGLGKTTVARICAAAILCETSLEDRPDGDACGTCETCLEVTGIGRDHPDVIEFDAASHGGKDEVRDIAARAALAPMRASRKIYIIDEAHGLSGPGGQAFLKLLEEPPAHVVFMLATTDPHKMLKTNRSRCTEFELLRPTEKDIRENLQRVAVGEDWVLSDRVADAVVSATAPELGVRGTLMTLQKLAGVLADGVDPDEAVLAELLGVAPSAQVALLTDRVVQGDRLGALEALTVLRERVSDGAVRSALLAWARSEFLASAAGEGTSSPEMALHRYEVLAAAPSGEVWTECTVARLAVPALVPDAAALEAVLAETEALAVRLQKLLLESQKEHAVLLSQVSSPPIQAPVQQATAPPAPRAPVKVDEVAPTPPAQPVAPEPVEVTPEPAAAPDEPTEVDDPFAGMTPSVAPPQRPRQAPTPHIVPDGVDLGWGAPPPAAPVTPAREPAEPAEPAEKVPPARTRRPLRSPAAADPPSQETPAQASDQPLEAPAESPPEVVPEPTLASRVLAALQEKNPAAADFVTNRCVSLQEGEVVVFVIPLDSLERVRKAGLGKVVAQAAKDVGVTVRLRPGT